jgi:3-hydroxyacyl-[acyl-carrier-protein] dehydratase
VNIEQILEILPHRYPFLLVDRVVELEPGARIKAFKNVTANEEFFNGHFPGQPVMPGVLIIEAMAQAVAILGSKSIGEDRGGRIIFLAGVDGARFRKPVKPGDRLDIEGTVIKRKAGLWKFAAVATVDGEKVAEAELMATLGK